MIRRVESEADLETWVDVRNVVVPNEPAAVEQVVYADEPHSIAFAEHFGLEDVDYQLEQVRTRQGQGDHLPGGAAMRRPTVRGTGPLLRR